MSAPPGPVLRRAAFALAVGLLGLRPTAGFAARPAPAPAAPASPGGAGCAHDAALEAAVARALRKRVRDLEATPGARIEISFGCPAVSEPHHVTALIAHGHGGSLSMLDLDTARESAASEVRALRLQPARAPELAGRPPQITRAVVRRPADAIRHALAFASAALASSIRVELPAPVPGGVQTIAARATTHDEALEIRLVGPGDQSSFSRWDGYVDSVHAPARVPLEIAWEALWDLAGGRLRPGLADDPDRAAYQRVMEDDGARPRFVEEGLLELGAALATRPLVPSLTPFLEAPSERTRTLAVNALATATGTDLRRDAAGAVRPLADVTAAYRGLVAQPPARHD